MRVISLGSGSSGNALFVEAGPQGRTRFLVDAGLSARTIVQRLRAIGISPSWLSGILVTHEHNDHIKGIPMFMEHYAVPVIADPRTLEAVEQCIEKVIQAEARRGNAWKRDLSDDAPIINSAAPTTNARFVPFPVGSQRLFGDVEVTSFATSHDAVAPCGYLLCAESSRVCVVIDTGKVTPEALKAMRYADLLILEANYHRERLLEGPYPWSVKRRIMSSRGHLSNAQAARAVLKAWSVYGRSCLWLAHLSATNNTPALAIDYMRAHLQNAGVDLSLVSISALPPDMGEIWDSTRLWHNLS
jgi:phosphoribosyl 1,2-cyclic phosphodiesterase